MYLNNKTFNILECLYLKLGIFRKINNQFGVALSYHKYPYILVVYVGVDLFGCIIVLCKWTVHGRFVLKCQRHNRPQYQYKIKVNFDIW